MKQFKIITLMIASSMLLWACPGKEDGHHCITIINQSDKTIGLQAHEIKIGETSEQYACRKGLGMRAHSNSSYWLVYDNRGGTWESELNGHYLQITVMDTETYDNIRTQYGWDNSSSSCDSVRKYVPVLHCYQLTLEDLQQMNWTVVYPPE
jgi:hypothetical protein